MQDASPQHCDILVVGGGPAGSTASALLARRGWRVLQLEKARHPRFHIGESLLPANLPLLEELGVLEEVRGIGLVKRGADFPSPAPGGYSTFRFDDVLGDTPDHAFQVRRDQFDALLFDHARRCGVDAREGVRVEQVAFAGDDVVADCRGDDGARLSVCARYLVDASGRDTFLGNRFASKRRNRRHASAALFAHFAGVARRPGEDAGNISIYRFDFGWAWFIPLPDGLMSIGVVAGPAHFRTRRGDQAAFLLDTLRSHPEAAARMRQAELATPVHATGNYSYACRRMAGPRWLMVGDAWAFVDPIFSSGVFLAMHSARLAVDVVDGALRTPALERRLQRRFRRRVGRGVRAFSWFIYRFNSTAMRHLFAHPSDRYELRRGVVSMLAGDVFDSKPVRRRLRVFKAIHAIASLVLLRQRWAQMRQRRRPAVAADGRLGDGAA
ncbi:MAG: tryptophan 7-halogenase [Xanthomonadales bacterium]|nr:tryptophan 7-halogenase [Xanthomonadales bacterium]